MILEIKDLIIKHGNKTIIDGMNFSMEQGEKVGLLGPNGAGKTTTIKCLLGLLPIDGGSIHLFGLDIEKQGNRVKKQIGYIPQELSIYEELTAFENVCFFGSLYGYKGQTLRDMADHALHMTDLYSHRQELAKKFSGGMKRRLNIACGIVHNPKLIVMDEPTVGIDPESRLYIEKFVGQIHGCSIIYTSHYLDEVERLCSKIAILSKGKIIFNGKPQDLNQINKKERNIFIKLLNFNPLHSRVFENMIGVIGCDSIGKCIRLKTNMEDFNFNNLIKLCVDNHFDVTSISEEEMSLEENYLTVLSEMG